MELDTNARVQRIVDRLFYINTTICLGLPILGVVVLFLVGNYSKLYHYWNEGIGYCFVLSFVTLYGLKKRKEWVLHILLYTSAYKFVLLCFNPVPTTTDLILKNMVSVYSIFLIWFFTTPETKRVFNETSKTLY
jgi:hypothetical protein